MEPINLEFMLSSVSAEFTTAGRIIWYIHARKIHSYEKEGLHIHFSLSINKRYIEKIIKERLLNNNIKWIWEHAGKWWIDTDLLYSELSPPLYRHTWISGVVNPIIDIDTRNSKDSETTDLLMIITKVEMDKATPKNIFLSHRSIDKPIVLKYFSLLKELGFQPWLDDDAMVAGIPLERGLLEGMKKSCAAVFFITPNCRDEDFIATEINYAMTEKRLKKDKFSIISLLIPSFDGKKGEVPELLKQYVWKEPQNDLDGMREIIRALPITLSNLEWKDTLID